MARKRDIKGSAETNIRQGQRIRRLQEDVEEVKLDINIMRREINELKERSGRLAIILMINIILTIIALLL